jgi:hypothetical protein
MRSSTVFEAFQEDMRQALNSNMPASADKLSKAAMKKYVTCSAPKNSLRPPQVSYHHHHRQCCDNTDFTAPNITIRPSRTFTKLPKDYSGSDSSRLWSTYTLSELQLANTQNYHPPWTISPSNTIGSNLHTQMAATSKATGA